MSDDETKVKTYQTRFELTTIVHVTTYLPNEPAMSCQTEALDNLFFALKISI